MQAEYVKPDLDNRENIESFVDQFYQRVLTDKDLRPIFLQVAGIDLAVHLPHIKNYWCKLLLGDKSYQRHTMNIHRQLHAKRALQSSDFERWLSTFQQSVDAGFSGPRADRAKVIATTIAENMSNGLGS